VIEQPAGRGDHDIDAAAEGMLLRSHGDAAEDRGRGDRRVDGELIQVFQDLRGQFAGRGEDQRLGAAAGLAEHPVQQRQHERGGFATSGRGTGQEVAALQGGWNGGRLDGRRSRETKFFDAFEQAWVEIQRSERHNHDPTAHCVRFDEGHGVIRRPCRQRLRARITTR
jgi:hypothetical protein